MDLCRQEVQIAADNFIQSFRDGSKQSAKNNAFSDLKAGCRSMQFVSHLQALPSSTFSVVFDIICANCFNADTNDLNDDMVILLYEVARGGNLGYPTPTFAKVLSALVQTIIREIINDENADLEDLSFVLHLQTLSICLYGNIGVRLFVAELKFRKELVRTLALMLNRTDDPSILIHSMSILARLVLNEPVGRKLFQQKNVEHAVDLVAAVITDKNNTSMLSMENTSSRERVHLQLASVDLLVDLASQPWILSLLESSQVLQELTLNMLARLDVNENILRLQVALHFLSSVTSLSHRLKKELGKSFPPLSQALPVVLHPAPMLAIKATSFFVAFLSDDRALVESLIDTTCNNSTATIPMENSAVKSDKLVAPLQPVLISLFKTLHSTISLLVRLDGQFEDADDEYDHAVLICQLLVRLSVDSRIWSLSLPLVNLSQLVGLAQREVQYLNTLSTEHSIQYTPRFSLAFMTLLGALMMNDEVDDEMLREFNQALQQPEISTLLSLGLSQSNNKQWTMDVLLLLRRILSQRKGNFHERVSILTLADTLYTTNHKIQEVIGIWNGRLSQSDTALQMAQKQIENLKKEMEMVKMNSSNERLQYQTEHARLQKELDVQKITHEQVLEAITGKFESQMELMKSQCDELFSQLQEKSQQVERKQRQLQESRIQRCTLEEENNSLKRKLLVLEMRIDEIAQAHAVSREEVDLKEKDRRRVQAELESLSEAYATQGGDLLEAQDAVNKLKAAMQLQEEKQESLYKQLVLLSKAHQQQSDQLNRTSDQRDQLITEMQDMTSKVESMESQAKDASGQIHSHKEHIHELESTINRYEQALHEEKSTSLGLRNDVELLRHEHVKLQSEVLAKDARTYELQRLVEASDKSLTQRDIEIQRLKNELKKYAKIQAMIHQLSDGASLTSLSQQSNGNNSPNSRHGFVPETQLSQ